MFSIEAKVRSGLTFCVSNKGDLLSVLSESFHLDIYNAETGEFIVKRKVPSKHKYNDFIEKYSKRFFTQITDDIWLLISEQACKFEIIDCKKIYVHIYILRYILRY